MKKNTKFLLLIATAALLTTGLALAAQNGSLRFLTPNLDMTPDYADIIESPREMTYPFTLENLPEYFDAGVEITGSGYTGQPHTVKIWVSHDRPDSSIWFASGNYSLDLELNGDVEENIIPLGSFTALRNTTRYDSPSYPWTPLSPAANYNITLSLSDIFWTSAYTITAIADLGGSISPNGSIVVPAGAYQPFTISPFPGYQIDNVTWNGKTIDKPPGDDNIVMEIGPIQKDITIYATFLREYTITASAGAGGSIDPLGATTVLKGFPQGYTITPDSGYAIANVLVDGDIVGNVASYLFENVHADHSIHAIFNFSSDSTIFRSDNVVLEGIPMNGNNMTLGTTLFNGSLAHPYVEGEVVEYNISLVDIEINYGVFIHWNIYYEFLDGSNRTIVVENAFDINFPNWPPTHNIVGTFTAPSEGEYRLVLEIFENY